MTPEQLLQPRYEVIAPYPLMPYNVGDLLHRKSTNSILYEIMNFSDVVYFDEEDISKYTHIFRLMHWSERRVLSDMPQYVKYKSISTGKVIVFKSDNWHYGKHPIYYGQDNVLLFKRDNKLVGFETYYLPATEQEYTNYQNYLNQTK